MPRSCIRVKHYACLTSYVQHNARVTLCMQSDGRVAAVVTFSQPTCYHVAVRYRSIELVGGERETAIEGRLCPHTYVAHIFHVRFVMQLWDEVWAPVFVRVHAGMHAGVC